MSAYDDDKSDDDGDALTVAAIGGAAALLWLLLRRKGNGGRGNGAKRGEQTSAPPKEVGIRVRGEDRVEVDGIRADLVTAVALARAAGAARFEATGDTREGWLSKVYYALLDAGVRVSADPDIVRFTKRFADKERTQP